jgi:acyl dehydratase
MFGRFYEEFDVGDIYIHWPGKTITESDNNLFSLLTMNHHPVHLDANYAAQQQHGKILVVGTLVFSLVVGQSVSDVSGKAVANLNYVSIEHLNPVFIGDTIHSKSTVISKRVSTSNPKRGIVKVKTEAWNQDEKPVLIFERSVLVPSSTM